MVGMHGCGGWNQGTQLPAVKCHVGVNKPCWFRASTFTEQDSYAGRPTSEACPFSNH